MSKGDIPTSVSFVIDNLNDSFSQLTGQYCGEELGSDPYYYCLVAQSSIQEKTELQMQLVRQKEMLDKMSSTLSQYQAENEVLKAEKASLFEELASSHQKKLSTNETCISSHNLALLQMHPDTNAKLVQDYSRLKVIISVMRSSFHSYIKDSRRRKAKDQQTIKDLQQEVKLLQKQQMTPEKSIKSTPKTSFESSFSGKHQDNSPEYSAREDARNTLNSTETTVETSSNDWTIQGEDNEVADKCSNNKRAANRESTESSWMNKSENECVRSVNHSEGTDFIANFYVKTARRPQETKREPVGTIKEIVQNKSDGLLLVDFDETRRAWSW
eukprot:CAMPEP_0183725410 /NCGR_PEP_ID=MMETSP0737-20130205/20554_1 /TAXON_ID=385413 /ORGANISM="Thalassiosira miniscula, Strain CCMP1093" /LENGTH=327 /DNA_ID=CAMNT_0025956391 /DNA_START=114 /DNA_END=1094 /DNA_ORIENTATION=+